MSIGKEVSTVSEPVLAWYKMTFVVEEAGIEEREAIRHAQYNIGRDRPDPDDQELLGYECFKCSVLHATRLQASLCCLPNTVQY